MVKVLKNACRASLRSAVQTLLTAQHKLRVSHPFQQAAGVIMTLQLGSESKWRTCYNHGQAPGLTGISSSDVQTLPVFSGCGKHTTNTVPNRVLSARFRCSIAERADRSWPAFGFHYKTHSLQKPTNFKIFLLYNLEIYMPCIYFHTHSCVSTSVGRLCACNYCC